MFPSYPHACWLLAKSAFGIPWEVINLFLKYACYFYFMLFFGYFQGPNITSLPVAAAYQLSEDTEIETLMHDLIVTDLDTPLTDVVCRVDSTTPSPAPFHLKYKPGTSGSFWIYIYIDVSQREGYNKRSRAPYRFNWTKWIGYLSKNSMCCLIRILLSIIQYFSKSLLCEYRC